MSETSQAIEKALQFEKDGINYYGQALEISKHPDARNMFVLLEGEEKKHVDFLDSLKEKLAAENRLPDVSTVDLDRDFKRIFQEASGNIDQTVKVESDEIEALSKAIDFEKRGYEMYLDLAEKAGSDEEKDLFSRLAQWEKGHMEYVHDFYDYFQDKGLFTEE